MSKEYKMLIGGEFVSTKEKLEVRGPYNDEVVGTTTISGDREIEEALKTSHASFKVLKELPSYRRAEYIMKVVEGLTARTEEMARLISMECGKPINDARGEVGRAINAFTIAAEETKRLTGTVLPLDIQRGAENRTAIIERFPIGVIFGVSPFNFPLNLVAHKVAPAMASMNPIILKPAPKTPLTALLLGEIINDSGYPVGGVNIINVSNDDAVKILEDNRVKKLTFTGSSDVGWMLKAKANKKKVTLELGGNAGVIIDKNTSEAELDFATTRCAIGAFAYAGQVCISLQRIFVHKDIFNVFKEKFITKVKALKLGDPLKNDTNVGPMIEAGALDRVEGWVKEAVEQGAEILTGGKRKDAVFFEPTVLTNVKPSMKVCSEEIFGPVCVLSSFDNFEDAVREIDDSEFGLQAGVFTNDIKKAHYAYRNIEAGGVIINDIPTFRVDSMPYGGVKESGFGREGIRNAIIEMTEERVMVINLQE